ncbi:MAG: hypothetical protein ACKVS9_03590 [Phycisphaerae bacterium]
MTHPTHASSKPPRHQVDPALYADADGIVQVAVPCAFCSYNLQTLRLGSNCPECGKAVGFGFVPELLQNAPVEWLRRVRLGLNLYFLWVLLYFVAIGAVWLWLFNYEMPRMSPVAGAPPFGPPAIANSIGFHVFGFVNWAVFTALSLWATWLFTTSRPDVPNADRPISRKTLRNCVAISAVAMLVWSAVVFALGVSPNQPNLAPPPALVAVMAGFLVIWLLGFAAWWRYIATLLKRVPSRRMSHLSQFLAWLTCILAVPYFGIAAMMLLQPFPGPPAPPYAVLAGAAPALPTTGLATASAPTSQWVYVTASMNSQIVTTLPAGTPIFTPAMPSRAFFSVGLLAAPFMCCGIPVYFIGAVVTIIHLARSLGRVHALAVAQSKLSATQPPTM